MKQSKEMEDKNRKEQVDYNEYNRMHYLIRRELGKANHCSNIDCDGVSQHFDWALIHNKNWKLMDSYFQLCRKCHAIYDETQLSRTKKSESLKKKVEVKNLSDSTIQIFNSMNEVKEFLETYNNALYDCLRDGKPINNYVIKYVK